MPATYFDDAEPNCFFCQLHRGAQSTCPTGAPIGFVHLSSLRAHVVSQLQTFAPNGARDTLESAINSRSMTLAGDVIEEDDVGTLLFLRALAAKHLPGLAIYARHKQFGLGVDRPAHLHESECERMR